MALIEITDEDITTDWRDRSQRPVGSQGPTEAGEDRDVGGEGDADTGGEEGGDTDGTDQDTGGGGPLDTADEE